MRTRGVQVPAKVISNLDRSRGPKSAYDILNALQETYPKAAPTTAQRARGFASAKASAWHRAIEYSFALLPQLTAA